MVEGAGNQDSESLGKYGTFCEATGIDINDEPLNSSEVKLTSE